MASSVGWDFEDQFQVKNTKKGPAGAGGSLWATIQRHTAANQPDAPGRAAQASRGWWQLSQDPEKSTGPGPGGAMRPSQWLVLEGP